MSGIDPEKTAREKVLREWTSERRSVLEGSKTRPYLPLKVLQIQTHNQLKFLHTADWHLGKKLNGFSRHLEQVAVLNEICTLAEQEDVNLVLIAGDLFDNQNPSIESTELFFKTLRRLSADGRRAVVAIAGNHDSPERVAAPDPLARACGIVLVGYPDSQVPPFETEHGVKLLRAEPGFIELQLPGVGWPVRLLLTPYANEVRLRKYLGCTQPEHTLRQLLSENWHSLTQKYCDAHGVNLLMAHLYLVPDVGEAEPESEDERSIASLGGAEAIYASSVPAAIQYVALGHIHKYWPVCTEPRPVIFSSSPLCYSFSEAGQTKYVVVGTLEPGKPARYQKVALSSGKAVVRQVFQSVEEAIAWLMGNQDALVEITLVSDTFLTAEDSRRLFSAHKGIVDLIPQVRQSVETRTETRPNVDLSLDKTTLFRSFFQYNKGQQPSDELLALFQEILSGE